METILVKILHHCCTTALVFGELFRQCSSLSYHLTELVKLYIKQKLISVKLLFQKEVPTFWSSLMRIMKTVAYEDGVQWSKPKMETRLFWQESHAFAPDLILLHHPNTSFGKNTTALWGSKLHELAKEMPMAGFPFKPSAIFREISEKSANQNGSESVFWSATVLWNSLIYFSTLILNTAYKCLTNPQQCLSLFSSSSTLLKEF